MEIKDLFRKVKYPIQLFNEQGKEIYYETSWKFWYKKEYNEQGQEVYYENSREFWWKSEFNEQGEEVYFETADRVIIDNRPKPTKELTVQEISEILGYEVKVVK